MRARTRTAAIKSYVELQSQIYQVGRNVSLMDGRFCKTERCAICFPSDNDIFTVSSRLLGLHSHL